jgi:hypothetical protein
MAVMTAKIDHPDCLLFIYVQPLAQGQVVDKATVYLYVLLG